MNRIGIIGGSFNPIHYGHLFAAEEARVTFNLDLVFFVPTGVPVWEKEEPLLQGETRLRMVLLGTQDNPFFRVSREEIDRSGKSFTVLTLQSFHHLFPDSLLFFITGMDALFQFHKWREPEKILELAELIAVSRPGYSLDQFSGPPLNPKIHLLKTVGVAVSSREIRERVRKGLPIKYLLPPPVEAFIHENKLYREEVSK
ncbi:MAG: nicotinate-nucleotide adenylyltransferase [Caldiserica bacterium]|jgi:nicotinate-nucleotide adenylyltransferase|nr:nicotinate-nucleotide adenylyltransferase [Caldisericota bacterium]MDH7563161.1 nicotinate-nucleotide adenylyltransferase [Caldisericota bacterium]